jgi:hypothetical protein
MSRSYAASPPSAFVACSGTALALAVFIPPLNIRPMCLAASRALHISVCLLFSKYIQGKNLEVRGAVFSKGLLLDFLVYYLEYLTSSITINVK